MAYCKLHNSNPEKAWRVYLLEFYSYWEVHGITGVHPELQEKGIYDEQAGKPQGYLVSSDRDPIMSNKQHDKFKRDIFLLEEIKRWFKIKELMGERHERELKAVEKEEKKKKMAEHEERERVMMNLWSFDEND